MNVKHGLCLYRCAEEEDDSHDAALFNHDVSGVDLYRASTANDLQTKTDKRGVYKSLQILATLGSPYSHNIQKLKITVYFQR